MNAPRTLAHRLAEPLTPTRLIVVDDGACLLLARGSAGGPVASFEIRDAAELRVISSLLAEAADALEPRRRVRCRRRRVGATR